MVCEVGAKVTFPLNRVVVTVVRGGMVVNRTPDAQTSALQKNIGSFQNMGDLEKNYSLFPTITITHRRSEWKVELESLWKQFKAKALLLDSFEKHKVHKQSKLIHERV